MEKDRIEGVHVVLVPLTAADADDLAGLLDDGTIRGFLGVAHLAGLRARFASWETRRSPHGNQQWLNWIVRARDGGRALGWVQATVEASSASVAYTLLPGERGRGAASDAVRALVTWLRTSCGVEEVTASIDSANTASERVARAAGFRLTERRDDDDDDERVWVLDNEVCDAN